MQSQSYFYLSSPIGNEQNRIQKIKIHSYLITTLIRLQKQIAQDINKLTCETFDTLWSVNRLEAGIALHRNTYVISEECKGRIAARKFDSTHIRWKSSSFVWFPAGTQYTFARRGPRLSKQRSQSSMSAWVGTKGMVILVMDEWRYGKVLGHHCPLAILQSDLAPPRTPEFVHLHSQSAPLLYHRLLPPQ